MFVNKTDATPNGGWRYTHPVTGMKFGSIVYGVLLTLVQKHCKANNLPFDLATFEDELCKQAHNGGNCAEGTKEYPVQPKRTTIDDAASFISVAKEWMKDRDFVPQEEAERRAEICAACPENQQIAGCSACRNLVGRLTQLLGQRRTKQDSKLQGCRVCGCSNVAQVHVPLDALAKGINPDMVFPDHCWKKEAQV